MLVSTWEKVSFCTILSLLTFILRVVRAKLRLSTLHPISLATVCAPEIEKKRSKCSYFFVIDIIMLLLSFLSTWKLKKKKGLDIYYFIVVVAVISSFNYYYYHYCNNIKYFYCLRKWGPKGDSVILFSLTIV